MSRMVISNDVCTFKKAIEYSIEAGLKKFEEVVQENLNLAVFEKRNVFFGNVYHRNKEEYIAVTGTLLYKGEKGVEALKLIWEDFDGDVIKFKKECLGVYSLIIRKGTRNYLFGDYYGIYDICYYQNSSVFFVTNSLSTLATVNGLQKIDSDMLMAELIGCGHFDSSNTIFSNVLRLRGNEYVEISCEKLKIVEIPDVEYMIKYNYESEEKAIKDILQLLTQALPGIKNNFNNVAVNLTGGLDSRCTLAALHKVGCDIQLLYGEGKKGGLLTCREDKKVVQNIADKFNLPLYFMNWEESTISDKEYLEQRRYFFKKYGFVNIYDANENIRSEYEDKIRPYPEFMDFGYLVEGFRLRTWAENLNADYFTLDSYINDYLFGKLNIEPIGWDIALLKSMLKKDIQVWLKRLEIPIENGRISMDYFERLRWVAGRFVGSRMAFFVNEFTYSFPIYGIPQIHTIILSLPAQVIRGSSFQIKFLKAINPEFINDLMLFSHRRLYRITKSGKKTKVLTFKNIADIVLLKIPIVALPLKSVYRHFFYKSYRGWEDYCNKDLNQINVHLLPMQGMKNRDIFHNYNYFLACYASLLENIVEWENNKR